MFYKLGRDAEFNANNNDPAEAIRLIDLMLEKTKKGPNAEQMIVRGDAFLIKNDGGNAVSSYEQALLQDPRNVKAKVKSVLYFYVVKTTGRLKLVTKRLLIWIQTSRQPTSVMVSI